jgi:hypothetical protein
MSPDNWDGLIMMLCMISAFIGLLAVASIVYDVCEYLIKFVFAWKYRRNGYAWDRRLFK